MTIGKISKPQGLRPRVILPENAKVFSLLEGRAVSLKEATRYQLANQELAQVSIPQKVEEFRESIRELEYQYQARKTRYEIDAMVMEDDEKVIVKSMKLRRKDTEDVQHMFEKSRKSFEKEHHHEGSYHKERVNEVYDEISDFFGSKGYELVGLGHWELYDTRGIFITITLEKTRKVLDTLTRYLDKQELLAFKLPVFDLKEKSALVAFGPPDCIEEVHYLCFQLGHCAETLDRQEDEKVSEMARFYGSDLTTLEPWVSLFSKSPKRVDGNSYYFIPRGILDLIVDSFNNYVYLENSYEGCFLRPLKGDGSKRMARPFYTILNNYGDPFMVCECDKNSMKSLEVRDGQTVKRAFNKGLHDPVTRLIRQIIQAKCGFGALFNDTVALLVELDLERLDRRGYSSHNIPFYYRLINLHKGRSVLSSFISGAASRVNWCRTKINNLGFKGFYQKSIEPTDVSTDLNGSGSICLDISDLCFIKGGDVSSQILATKAKTLSSIIDSQIEPEALVVVKIFGAEASVPFWKTNVPDCEDIPKLMKERYQTERDCIDRLKGDPDFHNCYLSHSESKIQVNCPIYGSITGNFILSRYFSEEVKISKYNYKSLMGQLLFIHRNGILHSNIHPSNVLSDSYGVYFIDFANARPIEKETDRFIDETRLRVEFNHGPDY